MDNNIPENPESWSYPKTKVSKEEGNILEEKLDGLYVPGTGVALSHEAGNGLVQKSDGLYVGSSESIVLKLNSAFSESELLYHIMTNYAGVECSGFFYNTDQDEYCEFEGLYSPYTVGSETVHFGYMHITGLHTSVYSIDYYIDDEFEDTWHKRTVNDYVKSSDDLDLDDSDTLATSKAVYELNRKLPSTGSGQYVTIGPKSDTMNLLVLYNDTSNAVYIVNNTGLMVPVTGDSSAFVLSWVPVLKYFNVKSADDTPLKYLIV